MAFYDHITEFAGLPVRDYEDGDALRNPGKSAWRIGFGADSYDAAESLANVVARFVKSPGAESVTALIIGAWKEVGSGGAANDVVDGLVSAKEALPNLRALFFGEITMEESEVSWINQTDVSTLLEAFPLLEIFRVRGGQGLSLGPLRHRGLRSLIVETGGLGAEVVQQVASAELPELTHLELWLGEDNYGATWTMRDLAPIIDASRFPKLEYLGLRNSEQADEIALALTASPALSRIATLDLSMGNLSDKGGEVLLASTALRQLKRLDLHHHYLSNAMMKRFRALGIPVNLDEQREADDDDSRYIAVGE